MAAIRSKIPSVGSAQWILSERHQANHFVDQEVEEFRYSVRNELEWLNEHMADVFRQDGVNVADVFKTPGKLRGKTPRTARKKNPLEARQPLSDIFAPNVQSALSPAKNTQFYKNVAQFKVAEDQENNAPSPARQPLLAQQSSSNPTTHNTDSGYHGISEDEMAIDRASLAARSLVWSQPALLSTQGTFEQTLDSTQIFTQDATQSTQPTQNSMPRYSSGGERRTTDESFVSAHEDFGSKNASKEDLRDDDNATIPDDDLNVMPDQSMMIDEPETNNRVISEQYGVSAETASIMSSVLHGTEDMQTQMDLDEVRSPSDGSSPVKPLVRKSSLTFASLPAREPLVTKKSMGNRNSRTSHIDQSKARSSQMGRYTGGKSLGGSQYIPPVDDQDENAMDMDTIRRPELPRFESETTKIHNKTSTQRLHDRINMLGQSKERDSSKSASQTNLASQPTYPQLPSVDVEKPKAAVSQRPAPEKETHRYSVDDDVEEEDDDWIAPMPTTIGLPHETRPQLFKSYSADVVEQRYGQQNALDLKSSTYATSPHRGVGMFGHSKSASTSAVSSPNKQNPIAVLAHGKGISVSNPTDLSTVLETTTPPGSPTGKKHIDGPISASKARLYSALKAAKEKFIGSSAASAQLKLDALSQSPTRQKLATKPSFESLFSPKRRAQPAPQADTRSVSRETVESTATSRSPSKEESRRTRSSTERKEKEAREAKEKQRADDNLEKMREKERQKAAAQFQKSKSSAKEPPQALSRPGTAGKAERLIAQDERPTSSDEMPPPPAPKSLLPTGPGHKLREPKRLAKAPSKDALPKAKPPVIRVNLTGSRFGQPAAQAAPQQSQPDMATKPSIESLKSSVSSGHAPPPRMNRALLAAANKKKEEERKAVEKEQKRREMEQKRAQKAEDERLEKERKAAEQREAEAKKARAAQKAAQEAKQRQQAARPPSRPGNNNLTNALQQEKVQQQPHPRADLGAAKSISRMQTIQDQSRPVPPVNPAKPPKRIFQPEDDEPVQRPAAQRGGPSYQQLDAKRRKTIDEDEEHDQHIPSVKAPPIRHSNMRKDAMNNKFPTGYMQASQSNATMLKTATGHAHMQQMKSSQTGEMARFANGKIPFADVPNPPAGNSHHGHNYKTPARGGQGTAPNTVAKSSPLYPNGDDIELPDCHTDSEDEDDENEFVKPDWANSPALRELLKAQQLVDPEKVFGPIAPLQMEKVFKNPERHEKFRKRTSSAYWTNDMITEEERRRDREARERLVRDGGWQYHPTPERR